MQLRHFVTHGTAGLAALVVFSFVSLPANAQVEVTVNGDQADISPAPIIQAGRVFVPLRGVFERLGASVVYSNGTINATGNGRTIALQIGSTQATVNDQPQTIDVAPFIVGASTFVPLRFVSEALGASVDWDNAQSIAAISTADSGEAAAPYVAPTSDTYVDSPPPALPVYDQPYVPAPNYIWQPGYWAWGQYGYYWVPGTWVQAPQPGFLWTPGYWGFNNGGYNWNQGFWARAIGFYGGVNYGNGYYGTGYGGGRWSNGVFDYNSYVTRVNPSIVNNTYIDRSVHINNSITRISYNGGQNGIQAQPNVQELAIVRGPHQGMTAAQLQHVRIAAQDRSLLATVNHNAPPVLAVARPLSTANRPTGFAPLRASDRVRAQARVAPARQVPAVHAPPAEHAPVVGAPVVHTAPAQHVPAVRSAPVEPALRAAPVEHVPAAHAAAAQAVPAAPVVHAEHVHTAPAAVAPPVHAAPAAIPPPVHAAPAAVPPPVHAAHVEHVPAVHSVPAESVPAAHAPAAHAPAAHDAPAAHPTPEHGAEKKAPGDATPRDPDSKQPG